MKFLQKHWLRVTPAQTEGLLKTYKKRELRENRTLPSFKRVTDKLWGRTERRRERDRERGRKSSSNETERDRKREERLRDKWRNVVILKLWGGGIERDGELNGEKVVIMKQIEIEGRNRKRNVDKWNREKTRKKKIDR